MESDDMRVVMTAEIAKTIIQYRTKFPKMSTDEIGKLSDVSGSTVRRLLMYRDIVLMYPKKIEKDISREIKSHGTRILEVLCDIYSKPYDEIMEMYATKENENLHDDQGKAKAPAASNEAIYLGKVLDYLERINTQLGELQCWQKTLLSMNQSTHDVLCQDNDKFMQYLDDIRKDMNANFDEHHKLVDSLREKVDRIKRVK